MNKKNRIERNINYFKERVRYYFFKVFHMYEYELELSEGNDEDIRACMRYHPIECGTGIIEISYSKSWVKGKKLSLNEIDKVAFHEVCEAILCELQQLISARFITEKDIPNAVHRVIRRLENVVYPRFNRKEIRGCHGQIE